MATRSDELFAAWLWVYALGFVLLGLTLYGASHVLPPGLHLSKDMQDLSRDLLRDVAIALWVGVFVMLTLERLNAARAEQEMERYLQNVGESFLKAVFGKQIPEELFTVTKSTVLSQNFVRSGYRSDVDLYEVATYAATAPPSIKRLLQEFLSQANNDALRQHILAVFSTQYDIENVDERARPYVVGLQLLKPLRTRYHGLTGLTAVSIDGSRC